MIRTGLAATGVLATLALAACSSTSAATNTGSKASPSPSGGANGRRPGGTAGELVRIAGTSLLVNTQTGDVSVALQSNTPVTRTRTGSVADITKGSCITATGTKDSSGALTAQTVLLSPAVNGSCTGAGIFGGADGARPSFSPRPDRSPRPSPSGTPPAFARGQVTAVSGTAVTLQDVQGGALTVTVPTTVRVAVSQAITAADLAVGDCVVTAGQKDSAGVVQARSVNVVPPGPNCCSAGAGGFGFGRGGFGGGGGGLGGGGGGGGGA
jgi:hypothetical protein